MTQRKMLFAAIAALVAVAAPAGAQTTGAATASPTGGTMAGSPMAGATTTVPATGTGTGSATSGAAVGSPAGQNDLALYGTALPVVNGMGSFGSATTGGVGGAGTTAAPQARVAAPVPEMTATRGAGGVASPGVLPPGGTTPSAASAAPTTATGQTTASTTGTAPATGGTTNCASMTAVVGVSPEQMPGDCVP